MTASAAPPIPRPLSVDDLLAGPRGRRLCAEVADDRSPEGISLALTESVDAARYWQFPDELDQELFRPASRDRLRPAAEVLASATATAWWTDRLDLDDLHEVEMLDETAPSGRGALVGAGGRLERWRTDRDLEEEQHVGSDRGLEHAAGGEWWTQPLGADLVRTTPTVPSLAPAGLFYPEDSYGWSDALSWPLRAVRAPEVYEIDGPGDLAALVSRFPRDVTRSRRRTWWETTGVDGAWAAPDWSAVAEDYDAVHVTVRGYLTTAGTAVPVEGAPVAGACTVLAGWTPGKTVWLTDVLEPAGPARRWRRRDDEVLWDLVTDETPQTFDTPPPHK